MKRFAVVLAVIGLAACGPSANPTIVPSPGCITTPPPSDVPTPHCAVATPPPASATGSAAPPSASPFAREPTKVRLALDWTPNTDHTGFFVARHNGWYREAGIDLQVLPYGTVAPEQLLAGHQAECGISFQDSLTYAVAGGADIVSVAAILQRTASAIGVLA